ncbi:hypothetical protein QTP88_022310 [Uroleucon formosanum]
MIPTDEATIYFKEKIRCLHLIAASRRGVRVSFGDVFSIVKFYTVGVTKVAVGTTATVFTTRKKRKRGSTLWGRPTLNTIIIGFPWETNKTNHRLRSRLEGAIPKNASVDARPTRLTRCDSNICGATEYVFLTEATDKWTGPGIDESPPVLMVETVEEVRVTDSVTNTVTMDPMTPRPRNG